MRIALVHDWLTRLSGAERVLIELHHLFPGAPIYTLFADKNFLGTHLPKADIHTSTLQRMPFISRKPFFMAPFMASAMESFDLSDYDLVISSSVLFSRGLILRPYTKHICYCYSPPRMLWDRNSEYEASGLFSKLGRHFLRLWDVAAIDRVDRYVAISQTVQERIRSYWRKESIIIYPPVVPLRGEENTPRPMQEDYYLIVSRLYPHKNIHIAVDAFNKMGHHLVIIGEGPLRKKLQKHAKSNIHFLGFQPDNIVAQYYRYARAHIMPQEEDFGLTAVESLQYGVPVLALRKGGATETLREGITGEFFDDPIPEALADGVKRITQNLSSYDRDIICRHARPYALDGFTLQMQNLVNTISL